jgi:hypothetical protein
MQIIIDDPEAYTRDWVSPPKLHKREATWEIAEWFCVADEDTTYDQALESRLASRPLPASDPV